MQKAAAQAILDSNVTYISTSPTENSMITKILAPLSKILHNLGQPKGPALPGLLTQTILPQTVAL